MYILGISCFYHDAAAALLKDGLIVAAAAEERFTRQKHCLEFPHRAIKFCLDYAGITSEQLDYVGFYEKPLLKFERIILSHLNTFPYSFRSFLYAIPLWLRQKLWIKSIIQKELNFPGEVLFVEHHLAHAASSFLVSPFKEAAILTVDGTGEWATTACGYGSETEIKLIKEIHFPHSLGLLYSAVTAYLGFEVNNGEGKVMGLAAYGKPTYYDKFRKFTEIKEDGSFHLDLSYFAYHYRLVMFNRKFKELFGEPRLPETEITQRDVDLAATLQKILEESLIKISKNLYQVTGMRRLCLAGGVGLNSVANGRILVETPFEEIFIQPGAGDDGTSIGVAVYIYSTLLKNGRNYIMKDAYLGPSYSSDEVREFLQVKEEAFFQDYSTAELIEKVAELLSRGKIVGWFQGRMEFGPRSLGARSILADPRNSKMKDILNEKVKHRESFRPYAPSVILEEAKEYFELEYPSPFMLLVASVREDKKGIIPAVTHVDGTARIQTVSREENTLFYELIQKFKAITGVPMILNTSFNVRGEPIVCSPEDAYQCFLKTDMDCLVMGNFLIEKQKK
jgi:carbamoyltransferase